MSKEKLQKNNFGINVIGYTQSNSGLGKAVRNNILAMELAKIPVSEISIESLKEKQSQKEKFIFPVNLIQISLNDIHPFIKLVEPILFENRYTILFFVWESEYIHPKLKLNIQLFDEVWTPSTYCKNLIKDFFTKPIKVIPHPVEVEINVLKKNNSIKLISPKKFSFLFIFSYHSSITRKNPIGLIQSFIKAFGRDNNNVELIIKTSGVKKFQKEKKQILNAIGKTSNINLYDTNLDQNSLNCLIQQCNCYVSLHHSEGFGLTLAEAMHLGKPTVATNYSGNTEFMNNTNSYLVNYEKGLIKNNDSNFSKKTIWANPDIEDCAKQLQLVYTNESTRIQKSNKAKLDIQKKLSYSNIGTLILDRLNVINKNLDERIEFRTPHLFHIAKLEKLQKETKQLEKQIKKLKKNKLIRLIISIKSKLQKK